MFRFLYGAVLLSIFLLPGLTATAVAQEATSTANFVTPDPADCQIEPRSLDSIIALAGTPAAILPATPSLENAVPADDDTVAAVTSIAHESVACFNAGDFLRQFSFYTDEVILAIMPPGLTAEDLTGFLGASPEPLPEEARESVMVRDVMVRSNGEVTAYFVIRSQEGTFTTFVTLEDPGDGYVITSDIEVDAELATPIA